MILVEVLLQSVDFDLYVLLIDKFAHMSNKREEGQEGSICLKLLHAASHHERGVYED